jgi:EAL domain-containing protein (putative c-di-GMP-specific phosphodiesterase class I)/ActR/RegA family two-component response regulator
MRHAFKEYDDVLADSILGAGLKQSSAPTKHAVFGRSRAFVIDDEDVVCKTISSIISGEGFEVDSFPSAQLAFRALKHCSPEIIFLDVALEGSDAIDVLRKLAEQGYPGVVQLMSGVCQSLLEDACQIGKRYSLVMRPPIQKPFDVNAIRRAIIPTPLDKRLQKGTPASNPLATVDLREALKNKWLELWYQPKLELASHNFVGAEGLIRCRHPVHGLLDPVSFLPKASAGSLTSLTEHVVLTALRDWEQLATLGFNIRLAVNASIGSLINLNLPVLIRENRPKNDAWPGLILEVTESDVAKDVELAHEMATQLRIYGISLTIDDFGEGYSSFARLRKLPFAELKLDASFVKDCALDEKNAGICQAIIELAHNFGAVAVAEGLENLRDVAAVQKMGCDLGQGFLFARPMPNDLFIYLLNQRAKRR